MIRFYIDGTAGQKDGTEVTEINPITATGLFPSGSTEATKTVTVCIRADEGESYNQIMLGCNSEAYSKCRISSYNNTGVPVNLYAETVYTITVQDDRFLPILEDTVFHADVDYLILLDLI